MNRLTNKLGLPQPIVDAISNDDYTKGEADISCTELIDSALIRRLRKHYASKIEQDAADLIWALFGQSMHTILERAGKDGLRELRLYMTVAGRVLSGKFDHLALLGAKLSDYKVTSVWSVIYGKSSWELQLNVLAELLVQNGYPCEALQIVAILRDWQKSRAGEDGYPVQQVVTIPVPLWPQADRLAYIGTRMAEHFENRKPRCTDEERWARPGAVAVMKGQNKRALRLFSTTLEAATYMDEHPDKAKLRIDHRPAKYVRCEDYCDVAQWCPQLRNPTSGRETEGAAATPTLSAAGLEPNGLVSV